MRTLGALIVLIAVLSGCTQSFEAAPAKTNPVATAKVDCAQSDLEFFETELWPVLGQCVACHQAGGAAVQQGARLSLHPTDTEASLAAVRAYIELAGDTLVHKPTEYRIEHGGGGFFDTDSEAATRLAEAVLRFDAGAPACAGDTVRSEFTDFSDVLVISPARTLRKASLLMRGDLPSEAELQAVQGEEAGLRTQLRHLLDGPVFEAWLKTSANDHLLVRKYVTGMSEAQEAFGGRYYPGLYERTSAAFDAADAARLACGADIDANTADCIEARRLGDVAGVIYRETQRALAEEPLELIRHVVTRDLPYSEVLTADYRMMNPFSYEILDGESWSETYDPMDPTDWRPGQLRRYRVDWNTSLSQGTGLEYLPSAGILSSPVFQLRFPSTDTNRNRARARWVYQFFLGVDIERLAVRAMDPEELKSVTNPGAEGSSCFGCHAVMDPVAGAFQNWGNDGHFLDRQGIDALPLSYVESDDYHDGDRWYRTQLAPGFDGRAMPTLQPFGPVNGYDDGLQWLSRQIVDDPRFAAGTVRFWFNGVFGRDPLLQPLAPEDPDYTSRLEAWRAEQALIQQWAQAFVDSGYNLKALLVEMMVSPLFRAEHFDHELTDRQAALSELGLGRLLTPEQLDRKLRAVTGRPWRLEWQDNGQLLENYYLFYGGIDSDGLIERPSQLNSLMALVGERLANEVACETVLQEFWPGLERTLFDGVEITTDPTAEAGEAAIRNTLRNLIWRFWGVSDEVEVEAAWALYWALYQQRLSMEAASDFLSQVDGWDDGHIHPQDEYCRIRDLDSNDGVDVGLDWDAVDWQTGPNDIRRHLGSFYNPEQTLRPWVGVLVYLLTDIQFLTE